jgi:uncharacterized protein YdeI (YjbR/CyaY-like superfamily)
MSPRPHLKEQEREIEARLDAYVAAEDGSEAAYHAVRAFEDRAPDDLLALLDALSAERARSAALTAEADAGRLLDGVEHNGFPAEVSHG